MITDEHLPNRLPDFEASQEKPFENDKLGRQGFALLLNRVVEVYSDTGCVLSINGEWGTGKTAFVNMWLENLKLNKYRTIYYNAWKTDYISDPFIALISELKGAVGDDEEFRKISSKVCKTILSAGKFVLELSTGVDVGDITNQITKDLDDYAEQKTTLEAFKQKLGYFVADVKEDEKTPVVFVIDELDRCNPHFAVKVLERIKHLFDIPNIIFVLPICKSQLECSIKGFYGCERIDAVNYLRRFIDLEFELPQAPLGDFINHLFEYHKFHDYFDKQSRDKNKVKENIDAFKSFVEKIFRCTHTDARTMDKIFVLCRLVAPQVNGNYASEMDMIFLLCYIKLMHYDIYCQIRNHELTLQGLIKIIEKIFPKQLLAEDVELSLDYHSFIYALAPLLFAYNRVATGEVEENVLPNVNNQDINLECQLIDRIKLQEALTYARHNPCHWSSFKAITDRIDLVYMGALGM